MNNRREKILMFIILFLVLVNSATLILMWMNRPPFPPHHGRPGPPDKIIIERLDLDDAQIKKFEVLKNEHHSQMMKLNEEANEIHKKYFQLLESENVNDSIADSYEKQLANITEKREEFTFIHFQKLKAICKPDQIKLFNDFIGELGKILAGPKGPPPPHQ